MAFLERINPWNTADSGLTASSLVEDDTANRRFADEPDATERLDDDSLAGNVGDRVKKIVDDAERDAVAVGNEAEEEVRGLLDQARADARKLRDDAAREARALAADRVRRMLVLRSDIESQAAELASLADDSEAVMARVNPLLEALADRAAQIAREIDPEAAAAAREALSPTAPAPPAAGNADRDPVMPEPELAAVAVATRPEPLREVRLGVLRMAVGGASRTELEAELRRSLDADDATSVLDDVFGSPRSPFPKWAEAVKRAG